MHPQFELAPDITFDQLLSTSLRAGASSSEYSINECQVARRTFQARAISIYKFLGLATVLVFVVSFVFFSLRKPDA